MALISPAGQGRLAETGTPFYAGLYYTIPGTGQSTNISAEGVQRGGMMIAGRSCTITRIGVEWTVAGSSGSLVRLGLYSFEPAYDRLDLLVDAGTVDGTQAAGYYEVPISVPVTIGQILVPTATPQGGATTRPTLRTRINSTTVAGSILGNATATTLSGNAFQGFSISSTTGALSATIYNASASNGLGANPPAVLLKAAA